VPALLISGKLACLLGALLIFAPRLLLTSTVSGHNMHHGPVDHATALADQHLAGLLMVVACPLSYVLTAVVLAAQTMSHLERSALSASARLAGR
jgi:putative membrane protein